VRLQNDNEAYGQDAIVTIFIQFCKTALGWHIQSKPLAVCSDDSLHATLSIYPTISEGFQQTRDDFPQLLYKHCHCIVHSIYFLSCMLASAPMPRSGARAFRQPAP
jgi:hypothetical protein